jgi:hypothetical protein
LTLIVFGASVLVGVMRRVCTGSTSNSGESFLMERLARFLFGASPSGRGTNERCSPNALFGEQRSNSAVPGNQVPMP